VPLPCLSATRLAVVVTVTLADTSVLLASGGETAKLAMLVHRVHDPVDAGIPSDGLVLRVNEDNLKVLVGRVLVDPVRVKHPQVGTAATNTFLGDRAKRSLELELVHTLVGGLACE